MSLGFDNVEPNRYQRHNTSSNTSTTRSSPPPTASQTTVVLGRQPDISTSTSQMTVVPYAPSPPYAPTYNSVPSNEEIYGPERYSGHYHHAPIPNLTSAASTPAPSVQFNPAAFMAGNRSDPLAQRDFKDELTRAAGVVTPGVSDTPYIQYALEALTRRSRDARGISGNTSSDSDDAPIPRHQIIPQFTVNVARPPAVHQPPVAVHHDADIEDEESIPEHWPLPPSTTNILDADQRPKPSDEEALVTNRPVTEPEPEPQSEPEPERRNYFRERADRNFEYVKQLVWGPHKVTVNQSPPRTVDLWRAQPDTFTKQDLKSWRYAQRPSTLTYKPFILRTPSLLLFLLLCTLMITALIFSAVYSNRNTGFTTYNHSIYGGQYFLFRVLPQLLGALLLIYAQCVIAAVFRVYPLSAMASNDRNERRNAVFLPLYPKSFIWPQLSGPWPVWIPTFVVWLLNFTIPLLSSLFTVELVDGIWTWSTVQGVAWTLVAVYVVFLFTIVVVLIYWRQRKTGMMDRWEIRSLADIIYLVAQSNSLPQYRGLETAASRKEMRDVLDGTAERLGYWTTPEVPENAVFWSFGVPTTETDIETEKRERGHQATGRKEMRSSELTDVEKQAEPYAVRSRYLPWCFRDGQIIFFAVAGTILLIALLVVSFVPATDIRGGFLPDLSAAPTAGSFSSADFLYSFLPSLLGLILFLGFQSLDLTLRILAPWGELARDEGSRAETSLFLDYAACLPWQVTYKALKNRHWRVAFITFLSPLFILIPVLSGGVFMALTSDTRVVRVYPNVVIFSLILALLLFYLGGLVSLIPNRKRFRLPHAVTCLAEVLSFCCNEQLRTDEAFEQKKGFLARSQLKASLGCGKDWHRQGRWTFGSGLNNEERLGIKHLAKFTVNSKKLKQYDRLVRGKPISGPLPPQDSTSLFGH
ncbi:hypothetical protein F5Y18DRAFT_408088 [Xylariaceae sp. FL1019]|nr:hypothetical protein F5Y18DRAFT_408088 [Xylariaceae sp. FL1019]